MKMPAGEDVVCVEKEAAVVAAVAEGHQCFVGRKVYRSQAGQQDGHHGGHVRSRSARGGHGDLGDEDRSKCSFGRGRPPGRTG